MLNGGVRAANAHLPYLSESRCSLGAPNFVS
jgi:hypothetical protein